MDGPHTIIAIIFVAIVLLGGGIAAQYADKTAADKYAPNETATSAGVGTVLTLGNSSVDGAYYSDTAKVTNQTSGVVLDGGGADYTWNEGNGTVTIESQDAANTGLYVDYGWWDRSDTQQDTTRLIASILESGTWIPMLLVLGLVLIALAALGGLS